MPKVIINFSPKNLHLTKLLVNLKEAHLNEKNVKMEDIVNSALDYYFEDITSDKNHKPGGITESIRSILQHAKVEYKTSPGSGDAPVRKRKK